MKHCDVCNSRNVILTTRFTLAHWPYVWICKDCGASVGCIEDTETPLGKMAVGSTRYLRRLAHISFDKIWKAGFMTRDKAIEWMGKELLIVERFHISESTPQELLKCIEISETYLQKKGTHKIEIGSKRKNERIARIIQRVAKRDALHAAKRKSKRPNKRFR